MEQNQTQPDLSDDIAQAFEALRGEVSLTCAAVEGLTAARERMPDYSVTLAEILAAQKSAAGGIERLEGSPAARLSPASLTKEIVKAAADARAEDRGILQQYRDAMSHSIGRLDGLVERGKTTHEQTRRLTWIGAGGLAAGILLWSILPGAIARALPASWHVPEWMAARTMGMDIHHAAARLVEVSHTPAGGIERAGTN
ncbi:hypothetical protein U1839_23020 [Sphingomonas sp. RT2P30]|uniref:hypothetical protein n=1 Tax=Parasphingomonas halimpatiens TaxID=3096162 RepID=UPI002FCA9D92